MDRAAASDLAGLAVTGMTFAFPLRVPTGSVASASDVEQLQQSTQTTPLGQ